MITDNSKTTNKESTVAFRVSVDHKESMRAWADRLGITLTQLYQILVGPVGSEPLPRLLETPLSLGHLARIGYPQSSVEIIESNRVSTNLWCHVLSCEVRRELAESKMDAPTAQVMLSMRQAAEVDFATAFGAAVRARYPSVFGREVAPDAKK